MTEEEEGEGSRQEGGIIIKGEEGDRRKRKFNANHFDMNKRNMWTKKGAREGKRERASVTVCMLSRPSKREGQTDRHRDNEKRQRSNERQRQREVFACKT